MRDDFLRRAEAAGMMDDFLRRAEAAAAAAAVDGVCLAEDKNSFVCLR